MTRERGWLRATIEQLSLSGPILRLRVWWTCVVIMRVVVPVVSWLVRLMRRIARGRQ